MIEQDFRAGYVAIIGEPNVGKSTLMNSLLDQKISIVTSKPQTTRHKILGILSRGNYQMIVLDTPGILQPRYELHRLMMGAVKNAVRDADLLLVMIDGTDSKPNEEINRTVIFDFLDRVRQPVYLLINKIDRMDRSNVASIIVTYSQQYEFKEIFPISALNRVGTDSLLQKISEDLPVHPPYFPTDIVSEQPERFFVGEIIREKIFETYRDEIPYSTTVEILVFKEEKGKKDLIDAEIYVERDSQKGILIGKGGHALKEIGEEARRDIEAFLERPVFLQLHVKVRAKWRNSAASLKRFGYHV